MPDRYQVRIPAAVDAKMAAWEVPPDVLRSALDKVRDELAADPAKHLWPCIASWGERLNLYSPSVWSSDQPHVNYLFMFHVVYGDDEASLNIVDCGYLKADARP